MATKQAQRIKEQVQKALERDEPETPRQRILDEASELTHSSRNAQYGNPEDNFKNIVRFWNAHLRAKFGDTSAFLDANDVAVMMIGMKLARLSTNPNHHDSCVDIAGYAACLGDIQASETRIYHSEPASDSSLAQMAQNAQEQQKKYPHEQTNPAAMKGALRRN